MRKDLVLVFDFDGTIADSAESMNKILSRLASEFGFNKIDLNKLKNLGSREILKELGIPSHKLPFILSRIRKNFSQEVPNLKPIPGIPKVLETLNKKGQRMGIVTSNSEDNVRKFLQNNKLDCFKFISGGSSFLGKDKKLKQIIKDRKLLSDQVIFIGDETRDIEAARKVGIKVLSVGWGHNTKKLLQKQNPDWLISEPAELLLL